MIQSQRIFFQILLASLALWLLFCQVFHTLHYPSWFDDSFFAIVAKSVANGEGYSAVFFDQSYPFHFGISVGPLLILPAAFWIKIFGNQYWVGDFSNSLIIWVELIIIFVLTKNFFYAQKRYFWSFCSLALVLLFSIGSYGNSNTDGLILWHLLMGEIPAFLALIIATLILFSDGNSTQKSCIGGLFLGCAFMMKTISAIEIATLSGFYAFFILYSNVRAWREKIIQIFCVGACALLPYITFELTKLIYLGWENYVNLQTQTKKFYLNNAALLVSGREINIKIEALIRLRIADLQRFIKPAHKVFFPITFYLIYAAYRNKNSQNRHQFYVGLALILASFLHLIWWLVFSIAHYRYLVLGSCCYLVGLVTLIQMLQWHKKNLFAYPIAVIFLAMLVTSRQQEISYLFKKGFLGADERLQQQKQIVTAITDLQRQGVSIISYGNNSELEYLLPKSRNFQKSEDYLAGKISGKVVLVNYYLNGITQPPAVIKIAHDQYFGTVKIVPKQLLQRCNVDFLSAEDFSMKWCSN